MPEERQPVILSREGRELFEMFAWPLPGRGHLNHTLDKVTPGCVRVEWDLTEDFQVIHRRFVEVVNGSL